VKDIAAFAVVEAASDAREGDRAADDEGSASVSDADVDSAGFPNPLLSLCFLAAFLAKSCVLVVLGVFVVPPDEKEVAVVAPRNRDSTIAARDLPNDGPKVASLVGDRTSNA
jgi:hypothetical protein